MELKGLLVKAQAANTSYQKYIAALEAELAVWRNGGNVPQSEWATSDKAAVGTAPKKAPQTSPSPTPSTPPVRSGAVTPINPLLEGLRSDLESRPQTPTVVGLDKDEREEFLKRENELSDQLAERERALSAAEKLVSELKEELSFLKDQESSLSNVRQPMLKASYLVHGGCALIVTQENKSMSGQLNEFRLQVERLNYDSKESGITIDILKEQNEDAKAELEELKRTISDLRSTQKDASVDDKEKRKQEKMAMMMAKFDTVSFFRYLFLVSHRCCRLSPFCSGDGFADLRS